MPTLQNSPQPGTGRPNAGAASPSLIVAPTGRDAELARATLADAALPAEVFAQIVELCRALDETAGCAVIAEEALTPAAIDCLARALDHQPGWSDLPLIVLAQPRADVDSWVRLEELSSLCHVTLLERPLRPLTLVSAVRAALRSRARQFDLRDRLEQLESSRAQIEQSRGLLRTLTDSLPVLVAYVDRDYRYRLVNKRYESWFECPRDQIIGRTLGEVAGPVVFDRVKPYIDRVLSGQMVQYEQWLPFARLGLRCLDLNYVPDRDQNGQVVGFIALIRDVTEAKRTRELQARQSAIVSTTSDAIIAKALDGTITDWNPGAEQMYGYPAGEAIGQPITLIVPADQQQAAEHLHRRVANEEHIKHAEVQRQTRDGRRLDVSLTLSPVRGDDGRVIGIAGIERDITDRKRDERALQAANTALQRKSEEMQQFFSIIAHDLKHPVVGVQGLLSMLELDAGDKLDAMSQENLKLALNECEQMKGMLAQLSQLGRIERRRVELVRRRLDAFVQGCADRFRAAMRDCGGQILVDADEAEVSFAASIVGEAVSNLIDNAIKYGCKAGDRRVMITARAREAMASIEVRDFGPGIAPQQHERIFQLFRRLDAAEHTAGSGVGLAAVRALVHRLGGDVSVVSDRGKGAAFTVEFPIDRVAESVNDEAVEPEREDTGNA